LKDLNFLSHGKRQDQTLFRVRKFEERPDWPACKPILIQVLKLLGEGEQWSLDNTMGDYLEATKRVNLNSSLEDWYKEAALKCLSHNNLAESHFAYAKSKDNRFQSMFLSTVGGQTAAATNGAYQLLSSPSKKKQRKRESTRAAGKRKETRSDLCSSSATSRVGSALEQPQVKRLEIWRITDTITASRGHR
jgi:hypothetical protein